MNLKRKITIVLPIFFLMLFSNGQTGKLTEYLGVRGPISFDKAAYNLSWTSHPSGNYYKQEYLVKGDVAGKFRKMILLEVLTGDLKVKDVVAAKVAELKKMKAANPVVNYEVFEKDGEIMLDFLVSESTPDGKYLSIIERNVYRYKNTAEKNGQKVLLLFGVSERAYGKDVDKFLSNLKASRLDLMNSVSSFLLPVVAVAK